MNEIATVAVIGSGAMGRGIAQAAVLTGFPVVLHDLSPELVASARDRIIQSIDRGVEQGKTTPESASAAAGRLTVTAELSDAYEADLVIEAIPENLELKRSLFTELDEMTPEQTILASNTSSLSISALAGATQRPGKVVGLHFFNPAHIMKLVEIIRGDLTADETVSQCVAFVAALGKTAVHCHDTPAFIVNRVARPFYGEAFRILGEQAADVATIDRLMRSIGFRMGPFELIDLIGVDVNFAVTQSVYNAFFQEPRFRPHPIQERMVASGRLGRKAGQGFYDYAAD